MRTPHIREKHGVTLMVSEIEGKPGIMAVGNHTSLAVIPPEGCYAGEAFDDIADRVFEFAIHLEESFRLRKAHIAERQKK